MLERLSNTIPSVAVDDSSIADSQEIPFGPYSSGIVYIPSGSSLTSLTWYVAEKAGGTYLAAHDEDGTPVTQTVAASEAHAIPSALFPARGLKALGDATGSFAISLKG